MRILTLVSLLIFSFAGFAASTQKKVELENQIRDRVFAIVERVDPLAIVQVTVNLKTVASDLPAMALAGSVTPVEFDGDLGASSIQSIAVRIVTQIDTVPDWIKKEIERTAKFDKVRVNFGYEKAGGLITDKGGELGKLGHLTVDTAVQGFNQVQNGLYGLVAVVFFLLAFIGFAVFSMAKRMEQSLARVIEEKVVPALAESRPGASAPAGGGGAGGDSEVKVSLEGGGGAGGAKELGDFPPEALLTLFADCYWTHSDAYAHYLWTQMTQAQREMMMEKRIIDHAYFWHIVDVEAEKQDYHLDARYLILGSEFRNVSQEDLLLWTKKNPKLTHHITPLRWDLLDISLSERLEFLATQNAAKPGAPEAAIKMESKSKPRHLEAALHIRVLKPEDEEFVWGNPDKVPARSRGALRSLVWLALCDEAYRRDVLAQMDVRELASAWIGPAAVLTLIENELPAKKRETLAHIRTTVTASRDSDAFDYLFEAGVRGMALVKAGAEGAKAA